MKPLAALAIVVAGLAAAAFAGVARPTEARSAADPSPATVTVTGAGSVAAVPDRGSLDLTVEARRPTASAALTQNASDVAAVVAAVGKTGVAKADIQTAQVSLTPLTSDDGTSIVGYSASNTLTVTVKILTRAGAIVDAAVAAGATGVAGPSLVRSDADDLYRQALKNAVADARQKAETLAAAAGSHLGAVTTIVEGGGALPVPLADNAAAATPTLTIEPGQQSIDASVTVTYALG